MPIANINGTDLYYRFDGEQSATATVVFSNSLSSNLSMWDAQIPVLIEAGYRTLRYDSRGHGQSSSPPGPYRIEQLAADVIGLIDHLDVEQIHFCGSSMGGMVAQNVAVSHPKRLKSVSLCATAAYMNPPGVWNQRIAAVAHGGLDAVVDGTMERWFTASAIDSVPQALANVRAGILGTSIDGYTACCAAIRDMDQRNAITAIDVPVMVLVGEQDPGTTVEHAMDIHQRIAGSSLVVIPQARHFVNVEKAEEFNRALLDFLDRENA